ncbi:MAG: tetratricopeptide repeat protein, partial [Pseudomonadota bacterium]
MTSTTDQHRDFFISRSTAQVKLAQWIGQLIATQGKSYVEKSEHFGHEDFMNAMHKAFLSGARVVALYSQAYLDSKYCVREAMEALKGDPANEQQRLIPLRIEPCAPNGMLNITYTDLLAERRQADAAALAIKICHALGLDEPDLDRLPPIPDGLLVAPPRIIHNRIRITRTDLAPRPELQAEIATALSKDGGNSRQIVAAVAGMGGAGKTVLAQAFALEHQDAYHGVWWIDAERRDAGMTNMLTDIAELGAELSAAIKAEMQANVERAARSTLRLIENASYERPFLLIYDNVNRPQDIEHWLPRAGAHVVLPTRYTEWDDMVAKVDVSTLPPEQAIDFLMTRGRKKPDQCEAAARLADALGCLPLALDHAASYCAGGRRVSFDDYLQMYHDKLSHEPSGASSAYGRSVRATFELALERAIAGDATLGIKACPEVEIVMGVAAHLAPVPIPFSLFDHPRLGDADLDTAFRTLTVFSLIAADADGSGDGAFTVHRLVQTIMQERLAANGDTVVTVNLALALLVAAFPSKAQDILQWETCSILAPHALTCIELSDINDTTQSDSALLGFNLAKYFQAIARYGEAEPLLTRSLAIYEKTVGPDQPSTSATLHELARLCRAQGRYGEAEPLLKRSLANREKTLGPDHPSTSSTLHELGRLYEALGRYGEAEPFLARSLAIDEKTVGPDHSDTSSTLRELARLYLAQGRYGEAEPLLTRSLAIDEKTVGPDHPDTSISLRQMALLALELGRLDEAKDKISRARAIQTKVWPAEHVRHAETL